MTNDDHASQQDQIDGIVAQVLADHQIGNDGDPMRLLDQRLADAGIELADTDRAALEARVRTAL
jgi:hypothetical protein